LYKDYCAFAEAFLPQLAVTDKAIQKSLERIGLKLIELRKQKGYTSHEDFALDYDLPRVQYWRLEKGKSNFTFKTLATILAIHKLTVEQFFTMLQEEQHTTK
jgi:transcriptional regulator with XRE-family HTH domain